MFLSGCENQKELKTDAGSNDLGYLLQSFDIKETSKKEVKLMSSYDVDTAGTEKKSTLSALVDTLEGILPTRADDKKLSADIKNSKDTTSDNLSGEKGVGNYKKGKNLGSFRLTAYCPCRICSEGWGRSTSLGVKAKARHTIAADKRLLKLGTWVIINDQLYRVEDTGGAVHGRVIDIFFNKHSDTTKFGTRNANVYLAIKDD